ncbi:uncharacterized protein LOC126595923 isoform X1 [Malus sylvestris]|uniref:uncharacterized protein LOC126595923 isoform X1 n=2 Tax=Malus sylvestris TaxID=3752 RepID=UPI0021ABB7A0|nr:uncharacterized protein LOC126595923 isoform X1 [Malus sylvestris]XP_050118279.1 uncharacterized protein LOC126595923 isoform X1 [Malus sylvestris]
MMMMPSTYKRRITTSLSRALTNKLGLDSETTNTKLGLPSENNMIRTVIVAWETLITFKEFHAQLLSAKRTAEDSPSSVSFPMFGMYCEMESSMTGVTRQIFLGGSSNSGANGQVYQGESSTHNDTHYNGNVGFVGQYQRQFGNHNGNAGFVGQYQRPSGNNGGYNGGQQFNFNRNRNNFRPRFNGGFNVGNRNNGGSSGSLGGYQSKNGSSSGSVSGSWTNWNGNSGQKPNVIPECQICGKRGHTTPNCFYRNE